MKSFLRFAFVFILLTGGAIAEPAVAPDKFLEWHKEMIGVRLPKKGCFKAVYPKKVWIKAKCASSQHWLYRAAAGRGFVGKGNNYSAEVTSEKNIFTSIGSFVNGNVTSGSANLQPANYSLQLNSQEFDTPACAGTKNPDGCKGVQQFVYVPTIAGGSIQYFLLNYRTVDWNVCPEPNAPGRNTNWRPSGLWDCTRFSKFSIAGPEEPIADLTQLSLGGTAQSGKWDILTVRIGTSELRAMNEDNILNLADGWRMAEFGVFGNGNGSQATFNPGTTLIVRTSVINGTTDAPKCVNTGVTGESNSLCLVSPCSRYGGETPAIVFTMSNVPNAAALCAPPEKSK